MRTQLHWSRCGGSPSAREGPPADLTIDEFFLILRLVPKSYQDMILVDQCTGLRAGELLALRWEAVNLSGSA
jgi:integrase